jgi:CBS domain-containing protein
MESKAMPHQEERIKHNMSRTLVSVTSKTTLPEAHQLMEDKGIRRLPVIEAGRLLGIVTMSDILSAKASNATSLSIWELNYLVSKLTTADVMSKNVITLSEEDSVAEAAKVMMNKKLGGVVVTDKKNKVIGIITESDIFKLVVRTW